MENNVWNTLTIYYLLLWIYTRKINKIVPKQPICYTIAAILATISIIVSLFGKLIFTQYKYLVEAILKHRLNNNFHGIISGNNLTAMLTDETCTINDLYYIKSTKPSNIFVKDIINHLKLKLKEVGYNKLLTSRNSFMGYLYNRRCYLKMDEIIKVVKTDEEALSQEKLLEILEICTNSLMPDGNKFNFDVFIIATPIDGKFVVLLRMHHSLVDGVTMYNLSTNLLCKKSNEKNKYAKNLNKMKCIYQAKPKQFKQPVTKRMYNTFYTFKQQSDTKLFLYTDPTDKYFKTIKLIMRKHKVSFQDVVVSAMSYSINKSFLTSIEDNIITCSPRQLNKSRMVKYYQNQEWCEYGNDFTFCFYSIPYKRKLSNINRLELVNAELKNIHNSSDFSYVYVIAKFTEAFPYSLLKMLFRNTGIPAILTNFPGGPKLEFFNGDSIEHKLFYCPKCKSSGIIVALNTYDDRLQLGITIEQSYGNKMKHFVDYFLNYLDEMSYYE